MGDSAVWDGILTAGHAKAIYDISRSRSDTLISWMLSVSIWTGSVGTSSLSPLHFQPAQHAYPAVMWPNRRPPLSRTCAQYSLRFWLASTVVPVTSTASSARAGVACCVSCCGKKVRWACYWYLSCATSFWRWSNPWEARQLCCMQVGGLALLSFGLLCCSVYLPSFLLLLFLLFKACSRYASDAVVFACTALELLLAEGLRAVVAILCCLRDL